MIYDPDRHMAIVSEPWNASRVRESAIAIFHDLCARLEPEGLWRAHPDEDGGDRLYNKCLYNGATGTLWSLHQLSARFGLELPFDPVMLMERIYELYMAEPDTKPIAPSFFVGESGIQLLRQKLSPSQGTLERLRICIRENISNPANEALWGCPGTMIVALRIGEIELYRQSADYLFEQWMQSSEGFWIWQQNLYGQMRKFVGAGHRFFGNVHALLEGQEHLKPDQRERLLERTVETALRSARRVDGLANWMPGFQMQDPRPPLTQWCHGAPGVITSLRSFPKNYSSEFETLLLEAGETIWASGPLKKGIGICHGTDGNGFALLRLFERTANPIWLERARRFAMHAMTQRNGRSTLWTGEAGLAFFLLACEDGAADFPSLDYF